MAKKKSGKKADAQTILINSAIAFGAGVVTEVGIDMLTENAPDFVNENPEIAELIPAAVGVGLLFMVPDQDWVKPAAYGMIGAAGAGMSDRIVGMFSGGDEAAQGTYNRKSRNMNGADADEVQRGNEYIDSLLKRGFEGKGQSMNGCGNYTYEYGMA